MKERECILWKKEEKTRLCFLFRPFWGITSKKRENSLVGKLSPQLCLCESFISYLFMISLELFMYLFFVFRSRSFFAVVMKPSLVNSSVDKKTEEVTRSHSFGKIIGLKVGYHHSVVNGYMCCPHLHYPWCVLFDEWLCVVLFFRPWGMWKIERNLSESPSVNETPLKIVEEKGDAK